MSRYRGLAVVCAAVFFGFAAFGATQEWSDTKEFTATETIEDEVNLNGEVAVTVASGKTVTLSSWVHDGTSSGKIKLLGGGTLVLAHTNDFTGGAYIDTGVLQVLTGGALGTGDITVKGSTTEMSQLQFGQLDAAVTGNKTLTFSNNITVENGGSSSYYQLMFGPHNSTSGNRQSLSLTGKLTCSSGDLYFSLKNSWDSGSNVNLYFEGGVDCSNDMYFDRAGIYVYFNSALKVRKLGHLTTSGARPITFSSNGNSIQEIALNHIGISSGANNSFGGAVINYVRDADREAAISLNGYSQTLACLKSSGFKSKPAYRPYVSGAKSSANSRLIITGGVDRAVFDGEFGVNTASNYSVFNVTVDAEDTFTQVITNCSEDATYAANTMKGAFTVKGGHLEIGGVVTFTNLTGIVVEGGSFSFNTADVGEIPALKSLNTLTVKDGAKLTLKGANLFKDEQPIAMDIGRTAELDIPAGAFAVSSLKVDGYTWAKGSYTKAQIPSLPAGVTLNVTAGDWGEATSEAIWTGDGGDNLIRTAANWKDGKVPALDGSVKVILTNGTGAVTGMKFKDGDWFNSIENRIGVTLAATETVTPFVLEPENEGDALWLSRGFMSDYEGYIKSSKTYYGPRAQVVVRGTLQCPFGSVGGANQTFYYCAPNFTAANTPQGALQPVNKYGAGSLSLVLDGVTIDMPAEIAVHGNNTTMFSASNSVNAFLRPVELTTYSAASSAEKGSVIKFCGGLTCENKYEFQGPGEYQILTNSATLKKGFYIQNGATMVLDATNIEVTGLAKNREGFYLYAGVLDFNRDNCFKDDVQLSFGSKTASVIEFNGTTQTVGTAKLVSSHDSAGLSSETPAMLVVNGKIRTGADPDYVNASACGVPITGWVGFHYAGTNELYDTFTLMNKAFTSYGDLEVSEGTMEIAENASWLNGTNFTARGTGTLKFTKADQISKDFSQLHIAGNGMVEIPEGVTVTVSAADLDGTPVGVGSYTSASTEAIGAHITGTGTLKVGKRGTMFILH